MSADHTAFVFPAFTSDYTDHPGQGVPGFMDEFNTLLTRASACIDPELSGFDFNRQTFPDDELRTQYITYIYSCAATSALRNLGFTPSFNAGYSMGIYAALFDAGSFSFETGLELIRTAYQCLHASLDKRLFGMGTLIGLDRDDILQLTGRASLRVGITNQNASHSFVVSGFREDIHILMEMAKEEGALHTRELPVTIPYHSSYLAEGAKIFAGRTSHLAIKAPGTPVVSLIDQVSLSSAEIVRNELVRNLFRPLNWFVTMQILMEQQVIEFIECGPSAGLVKNARFVSGNPLFYSLKSIPVR